MKSMLQFRALVTDDIPFAMELKNIAGWNQTAADWRGYLEFEPEGCFVAEIGGQPAGTATTIRYGERVAWIGMVLVHPDHRRLGIGTELLRHAIAYLQGQGTRCIKLDATPMGKKVYLPLGFREEYDLTRYEGVAPPTALPPPESILSFGAADLAGVAGLDADAFGADRRRVIERLSRRNPDWCFVAKEQSGLAGYLLACQGHEAIQLGPWIARDAAVAERLLRVFFTRVAGRRVLVDVPAPNEPGHSLIEKYGFIVQRGFTRMYLGANAQPGIPAWVFGTSSAEKG